METMCFIPVKIIRFINIKLYLEPFYPFADAERWIYMKAKEEKKKKKRERKCIKEK